MITKIKISDLRFKLDPGAGSDAIQQDPLYSYAVTELVDDGGITGTDPGETLDVKEKHPGIVKQLSEIADQYRKTIGDDLTNQKRNRDSPRSESGLINTHNLF